MNHKIVYIVIPLLSVTTVSRSMIDQLPKKISQTVIINPFFDKEKTITTIRNVMDDIENKNLGYPDYDGRTGLIWTDFWVKTKQPTEIEESKKTTKLTLVEQQIKKHRPESFSSYPQIQKILSQKILPKMFKIIKEKNWAVLPEKVFAQLFIQRCHESDAMDWHQDPGEDYDEMANFSLVLMLSKQDNPTHGWSGGEFKIRAGLPNENYREEDVSIIKHQCNQAILFNNQRNSHATTRVTSNVLKSKRDLIVVPIYLKKAPMPVLTSYKAILENPSEKEEDKQNQEIKKTD